jgi:hypothetical protein
MPRLTLLLLTLSAPAQPADDHPAEIAADERTLRQAGLGTDPAALLTFFRDRTLSADRQEELRALIKDLGDPSFSHREKASAALTRAGRDARPFLLLAREDRDGEVARRAELCLRKINPSAEAARAAAAARLLAHRKPEGAAAALLDYLPFSTNDLVSEDVQAALNALAVRDGRPDPALVEALSDPEVAQKAAAVEALCRAGVKEFQSAYLKALQLPEAAARLQVALALFDARHPESVPALIDLLGELPRGEVWRAEEALRHMAGDRAPAVFLDRATLAAKVRDVWRAWWKQNAATVDLAKLERTPRLLGHTLLTHMDPKNSKGYVLEVAPDREIKWRIDNLSYPVDAQVVGRDRVLIAEYLGRRVSERDFSGKIIWERRVELPIACQRLPNGHTFVATRRALMVMDSDGKDVFTYHHPQTSISAARKLRDGQIVLVSGGTCTRLDADGKAVKSFPVGLVYTLGGNMDVLPNGHILVPEYRQNRVAEYDADGQVRWTVNVRSPISAVRIPNGNTLVVSMTDQRAVEFNREGKEVWSYPAPGRLWRARRR